MYIEMDPDHVRRCASDPLYRGGSFASPWEALVRAAREGRQLSDDELDLLEAEEVIAAYENGLADRNRALRCIVRRADEHRERDWYAEE